MSRELPGRAPARQWPAWVLLLLAASLCALHLALPLATLPRHFSINYNEGWNAYHASSVASERPLYPAGDSLLPNGYPPLSFYTVALLGRLVGDPIIAGRMLSLASLLAIAAGIGQVGRLATGSLALGGFGGLLFMAMMGSAFESYVAMNDPELFAHAVMNAGLVLLIAGLTPRRLAVAAVLLGLGGLIKHNLIALPLAVTLWLAWSDRVALRRWLSASAAVLAGATLVLGLLHGGAFFASLLGPRSYSLMRAVEMSSSWLPRFQSLLGFGLLAGVAAWRDREGRLLLLYALVSLLVGAGFAGGQGVNFNVFFDLLIALCMLATLLLGEVGRIVPAPGRSAAILALGAALLIGPLLDAPETLVNLGARLGRLDALESDTREDLRYLGAQRGPALCETLALCFWAGKPPEVDLFNSRQAFQSGVIDEALLLTRIREREFAVVQLIRAQTSRNDERVSSRLMQELARSYVPERTSQNGVFLRPRVGD